MDRVKAWREEHRLKVEGVESEEEEEDVDFEAGSDDELNDAGDADQKKQESSDEENKPDEDFMDANEIIIKHDNMDQVLKGYRVEKIGNTLALNGEQQKLLEKRKDIDDEPEEGEMEDGAKGAQQDNKVNFFAA